MNSKEPQTSVATLTASEIRVPGFYTRPEPPNDPPGFMRVYYGLDEGYRLVPIPSEPNSSIGDCITPSSPLLMGTVTTFPSASLVQMPPLQDALATIKAYSDYLAAGKSFAAGKSYEANELEQDYRTQLRAAASNACKFLANLFQ